MIRQNCPAVSAGQLANQSAGQRFDQPMRLAILTDLQVFNSDCHCGRFFGSSDDSPMPMSDGAISGMPLHAVHSFCNT